jgi:hypothetical protein
MKHKTPVPRCTRTHAQAARQFDARAAALEQSLQALPAWDRTLAKPGDPHQFAGKAVERVQEMQRQMQATRRALGLRVEL